MITESEQSRQSARKRHQRRLLVTGLFTISITSDTCNLDIEVYSITRRCRLCTLKIFRPFVGADLSRTPPIYRPSVGYPLS